MPTRILGILAVGGLPTVLPTLVITGESRLTMVVVVMLVVQYLVLFGSFDGSLAVAVLLFGYFGVGFSLLALVLRFANW